jgi:hypothetical protein
MPFGVIGIGLPGRIGLGDINRSIASGVMRPALIALRTALSAIPRWRA